jgi:hypothetical protein
MLERPFAFWDLKVGHEGAMPFSRSPRCILAREYLNEMNFCPDFWFYHPQDVEFGDNSYYLKERHGQAFYYPSNCVEFPLHAGREEIQQPNYITAYHGTSSENIRSIMKYGLLPAGELAGDQVVQARHGAALGSGVYTSPCPLYAQLYAPVELWRGRYVQTFLRVRQPRRGLSFSGDTGCASTSLIGRDDVYRLYGIPPAVQALQHKSRIWYGIVVEAVLVKIHEQDPTAPGGEYYGIRELLKRLSENRTGPSSCCGSEHQ